MLTLVLGAPALEALYVGGRRIVTKGRLTSTDPDALATAAAAASTALRDGR